MGRYNPSYSGTFDVYGRTDTEDSRSKSKEQAKKEKVKLGERLIEEDEETKKAEDDSLSRGLDAYQKYKKYSKQNTVSGPDVSETMMGDSGGGAEFADSGGFADTAMEGGAGESGGMGSAASVAAIIYAADQAKKKWGGYNKEGGDLKLDDAGHYYTSEETVSEIPWDEKTYMQKSADAPASILGAGGLLTNFADSDSAVGKFGKEMARIEEQAFEPISKFISWLGLDL